LIFEMIIVQVRSALEQLSFDCSMEELVTLCPELTWEQVFLAIGYLSRAGQIRVILDGEGTTGCGPIAPSRPQLSLRQPLLCKYSVNDSLQGIHRSVGSGT
jgi:hypothetical protein